MEAMRLLESRASQARRKKWIEGYDGDRFWDVLRCRKGNGSEGQGLRIVAAHNARGVKF